MPSALVVTVGGVVLPGDIVTLRRSDELLWSEGTGRSASTGALSGSVVAEKLTYSIQWGPVTQAQLDAIRSACGTGFKLLVVSVNGVTVASATVYRGAISSDLMGTLGGTTYYRDVAVTLIER